MKPLSAAALVSGVLLAPIAIGQQGDAAPTVQSLSTEVDGLKAQLAELNARSDQRGLDILQHFGVGLVLAGDLDDGDRIGSASTVNGVVRVEADRNVRAGVILEFHSWMFCQKLDLSDPDYPAVGGSTSRQHRTNSTYRAVEEPTDMPKHLKQVPPCNRSRRASGLFIAVQPGSDELVDAIGAGWMWRLPDKFQLAGERVLNFGFGVLSDPNVEVLADGFVANMPAPLDSNGSPEQVRLRKTDRTGFFITASIEIGGR